MNALFKYLKQGPVMVGEVRGFKSEIGQKFDKSDKNAAPITFGVFKIHIELLGDGSPVLISIYPGVGANLDEFAEKIGIKKGAIVAARVGRIELKDGQRKATCPPDGIHMLEQEDVLALTE